jgi:NIMA (never in mitosis gene a)-related kinase
LRPPFMATSLHGLIMKINGGDYAPISECFSVSLDNLIGVLLTHDPEHRPNINQVLQLPLIQHRIRQHLEEDVRVEEFSHTIIHNSNVFEVA